MSPDMSRRTTQEERAVTKGTSSVRRKETSRWPKTEASPSRKQATAAGGCSVAFALEGAHVVAESSIIQDRCAGATTGTERIFGEVLADLLRVDRLAVESHFFDELGADSLVMAHFCARVRKRGDLPSISMRDIYRHPTIRSLAAALADATPSSVESSGPQPIEVATPASTLQYVLCGT